MKKEHIERLNDIEQDIKRIAEEFGLTTTEVEFEIVSSRKMIEAMAYRFTTNFSHWSFGRDYDKQKTPPVSRYDILRYILEKSPKPLPGWQKDIIATIRDQTAFFEFQKRCKLLNEGWATYVHIQIMRQLFEGGKITPEEHKEFSSFHSKVTSEAPKTLNWYSVGLKLYEDLVCRWDRGMHGKVRNRTNGFKRLFQPLRYTYHHH